MKFKKGFTLLEAVVTLGVFTIAFSLTTVAFTNLSRIQESSSRQYAINKELDSIRDIGNEYVSFVSLKTDAISFSYKSSNASSLVYRTSTYDYRFAYSSNSLIIDSTYSGSDEYLSFNRTLNLSYVTKVTFAFDTDLKLLTLTPEVNELTYKFSFVFRV